MPTFTFLYREQLVLDRTTATPRQRLPRLDLAGLAHSVLHVLMKPPTLAEWLDEGIIRRFPDRLIDAPDQGA